MMAEALTGHCGRGGGRGRGGGEFRNQSQFYVEGMDGNGWKVPQYQMVECVMGGGGKRWSEIKCFLSCV